MPANITVLLADDHMPTGVVQFPRSGVSTGTSEVHLIVAELAVETD